MSRGPVISCGNVYHCLLQMWVPICYIMGADTRLGAYGELGAQGDLQDLLRGGLRYPRLANHRRSTLKWWWIGIQAQHPGAQRFSGTIADQTDHLKVKHQSNQNGMTRWFRNTLLFGDSDIILIDTPPPKNMCMGS